MHTTSNYMLLNLVVSDLTTLSICPARFNEFSLNKIRFQKTLGYIFCRPFVGNKCVINVGALIVCIIAVERYLAMMKPVSY